MDVERRWGHSFNSGGQGRISVRSVGTRWRTVLARERRHIEEARKPAWPRGRERRRRGSGAKTQEDRAGQVGWTPCDVTDRCFDFHSVFWEPSEGFEPRSDVRFTF